MALGDLLRKNMGDMTDTGTSMRSLVHPMLLMMIAHAQQQQQQQQQQPQEQEKDKEADKQRRKPVVTYGVRG